MTRLRRRSPPTIRRKQTRLPAKRKTTSSSSCRLKKSRRPYREAQPKPDSEPEKKGRNVHGLAAADLTRLSIDNDGRLYWDGKPVEVRRRIQMSRAQIVGASVVAAFIVIGAVGAAVQGSLALRDWACRLGWTTSYCTLPGPAAPRPVDIPA